MVLHLGEILTPGGLHVAPHDICGMCQDILIFLFSVHVNHIAYFENIFCKVIWMF